MSIEAYSDFISDAFVDERIVGAGNVQFVVVELDGVARDQVPSPGSLPVVVLAVGTCFGSNGPAWADAVVGPDDIHDVVVRINAAPIAASSLCVLLRAVCCVPATIGLGLESAVYSTLQSGPEFAAWRARSGSRSSISDHPTVTIERSHENLFITLRRPERHNAISAQMRDELVDALRVAVVDDTIANVVLRGAGPSFCSGGDLSEFGMRSDPASAHVIRLARSPARLLEALRERTTVEIHGATLGGGLELAGFAGHVVAHPDTVMGLPELGLGLIPGAGGTVSLPRRIGRQRTAALALSCRRIDVATALEWGLIDRINTTAPCPS